MLINLWGIVEGNTIKFDSLPYIPLTNHVVGVKEILIEWNSPRASFIGLLTTSLIEKSPTNIGRGGTKRTIFYLDVADVD